MMPSGGRRGARGADGYEPDDAPYYLLSNPRGGRPDNSRGPAQIASDATNNGASYGPALARATPYIDHSPAARVYNDTRRGERAEEEDHRKPSLFNNSFAEKNSEFLFMLNNKQQQFAAPQPTTDLPPNVRSTLYMARGRMSVAGAARRGREKDGSAQDGAALANIRGDIREVLSRFDGDGDGALTMEEFTLFLRFWVFEGNKVQCKGAEVEAVAAVLFSLAGGQAYGTISHGQIMRLLLDSSNSGKGGRGGDDNKAVDKPPTVDAEDAQFAALPKWQRALYYVASSIGLLLSVPTGIFFILFAFTSWPKRSLSRIRTALKANAIRVIWLLLYIGGNVYMFTTNFMTFYRRKELTRITGVGVPLATGNAHVIRFNSFFILLPLCYRSLVRLRGLHWMSRLVPFDDAILFHKIVGSVIILASLGHSVGHEINAFTIAATTPELLAATVLGPHFAAPPPAYALNFLTIPGVTGWIILIVLILAMPWAYIPSLKKRFFNVFYHLHKLMLWVYIPMAMLHGITAWLVPPKVWYITLGPLVLYLIDRRYRMAKKVFNHQLRILHARVYPETTVLYIEKSAKYEKSFRPGHYLWLCIPEISQLEWHPFTITSACDDPYVSLHIQRSGDWSRRLHNLISDLQVQRHRYSTPPMPQDDDPLSRRSSAPLRSRRSSLLAKKMGSAGIPLVVGAAGGETGGFPSSEPTGWSGPPAALAWPSCYIDGPIGAPAEHFNTYEVTVMIGAGVGVTPCASITREMLYAVKRKACSTECVLRRQRPQVCCCMIQKLYFVWSTNKQHNLDWFQDTADQLGAITDRVEFHHFFTAIKKNPDTDVQLGALAAVQKHVHSQTGLDVISGLRTREQTAFGRPKWQDFFSTLASRHAGKRVGVFYCGPTVMRDDIAKTLKTINLSNDENPMAKEKTLFHFHAEQF